VREKGNRKRAKGKRTGRLALQCALQGSGKNPEKRRMKNLMKRLDSILAILLLLTCALVAEARPAPWYRWQSDSGDTVCAQTSPGPGWFRLEVVYVDPRCQRRDEQATGEARTKNRK
jgi:hypothetical protein